MTDYTELLELLRYCSSQSGCIGCKLSEAYDCTADLTRDAADAIEALQAEQKKTVTQIFCEEQQEWEEYCTGLMNRIRELKAQLPKRGEWKEWDGDTTWYCSVCGEPWTLIDGTPKENNMNYCPNCGAKMELQDGE